MKRERPAGRTGVTAADLRKVALSLPGVSEGTSHGKPSFLLGKKFFTRLRREDDSIVLVVGSIDERDMLLESDPALFHITDHYRNYPAVLARVAVLDVATLRAMLERRWRVMVPKKLVKEWDEQSSRAGRSTTKSTKKIARNGANDAKTSACNAR